MKELIERLQTFQKRHIDNGNIIESSAIQGCIAIARQLEAENYAGGTSSGSVLSKNAEDAEAIPPAPNAEQRSEISDTEAGLLQAIKRLEYSAGKHMAEPLANVFRAIVPYLTKPKPVSVSLERCTSAAVDAIGVNSTLGFGYYALSRHVAKAVLDAAGVPYVD